MKKVLIAGLFLAIPMVSHAVWWNPATWNKPNKAEYNTAQAGVTITNEDTKEEIATTSPQIVEVEKIVEKVVEKPVEKIVTKVVDNPALLKQIADLKAEVASLKAQLAQANSTPQVTTQPQTEGAACELLKKQLSDKQKEANNIIVLNKPELMSQYRNSHPNATQSEMDKYMADIDASESKKMDTLLTEIMAIKSKANNFCESPIASDQLNSPECKKHQTELDNAKREALKNRDDVNREHDLIRKNRLNSQYANLKDRIDLLTNQYITLCS